jgi:hypothetical protein
MKHIILNTTNPGNHGHEEILGIMPCWPSEYIIWDNNQYSDYHVWVDCWDGVSDFKAKYKIAVLMEPKTLTPHNYEIVESTINQFDLVFTHYKEDVVKNSKYKYYPGGCRSFIAPDQRMIYKKDKDICCIMSSKTFMPGHGLRHKIKNYLSDNNMINKIDYNNPPMDRKIDGVKDYRFELVIENEDSSHFSEKLIDSMLCGCIPVYWKNIDTSYLNMFDLNGIIFFKDEYDFYTKLNSKYFTKELYDSKIKAIKYNFEKAKEFINFGDVLWNYGLKTFIKNNK